MLPLAGFRPKVRPSSHGATLACLTSSQRRGFGRGGGHGWVQSRQPVAAAAELTDLAAPRGASGAALRAGHQALLEVAKESGVFRSEAQLLVFGKRAERNAHRVAPGDVVL